MHRASDLRSTVKVRLSRRVTKLSTSARCQLPLPANRQCRRGELAGDVRNASPGRVELRITQQAQIIAYIDDYKLLLMIATLAVVPLLMVFKRTSGGGTERTLAMEWRLIGADGCEGASRTTGPRQLEGHRVRSGPRYQPRTSPASR
jgi:hypothetical protein